jgi:hypothetical protein
LSTILSLKTFGKNQPLPIFFTEYFPEKKKKKDSFIKKKFFHKSNDKHLPVKQKVKEKYLIIALLLSLSLLTWLLTSSLLWLLKENNSTNFHNFLSSRLWGKINKIKLKLKVLTIFIFLHIFLCSKYVFFKSKVAYFLNLF